MTQAAQRYISTDMLLPLCLSVMSDSMIMDAIASFLVLPNRLVVPLVQGLHVGQLRSPLPRVKLDKPCRDRESVLCCAAQNVTSQSSQLSLC